MRVLTDLHNCGIKDTLFVVRDGPKGQPEVVGTVWPQAIVQSPFINNMWARDGLGVHLHYHGQDL
tara:strand:- start:342 stop:536 length:195 start_codon:yes stop_codon:yes gene_type:complete